MGAQRREYQMAICHEKLHKLWHADEIFHMQQNNINNNKERQSCELKFQYINIERERETYCLFVKTIVGGRQQYVQYL